MHHAEAGFVDRDRRCRLGIPGAAVVDHQTHGRPGRLAPRDHLRRRDRRRVVCSTGFRQHHGAGQHPHAVCKHRVAWHPQPEFAAPHDQPPYAERQPMHETVGMVVVHDDGHRAGPAPPRQPLSQRTQAGRPIERFVGAFERQRQPWLPRPFSRQAAEPLRCRLVAGAGGDHIVGFRREGDRPAFSQCLHRAMHDIAGVVGAAQINDHGRHGQGPTSWMPRTRRAYSRGKHGKREETLKNTGVHPAQSSIGIWVGRANRGNSGRRRIL